MFRVCSLLALLLIGTLPAAAATGDWVEGGKARIRLVVAGVDANGRLAAGLEIAIEPEWSTYWRNPGDAGIPPVFDFSASRNAGAVDVAFPPPLRHDDGMTVTNVYEGDIILPLTATLADPHAAGELAVKLDIGVCQEVCIPDHFEATLAFDPNVTDADAGDMLKQARDLLPKAPEPGTFAVDKVSRDGGTDKRPAFTIAATLPDPPNASVFVEGPADWYGDVPKLVSSDGTSGIYRVTFDRLTAKTPLAGAKLRVTIVSAGRAMEQWIGLD
jgi:DsbC/DsbD-like thiol-disulfide interchange protein